MRRCEILDGYYLVTDCGDIIRAKPGQGTRAGRPVKHTIGNKGYQCVALCVDGMQIVRTVHSLVAEAFIGTPSGRESDSFKDSDRTNCNLSNLHYVPKQGNIGEERIGEINGSASQGHLQSSSKGHERG